MRIVPRPCSRFVVFNTDNHIRYSNWFKLCNLRRMCINFIVVPHRAYTLSRCTCIWCIYIWNMNMLTCCPSQKWHAYHVTIYLHRNATQQPFSQVNWTSIAIGHGVGPYAVRDTTEPKEITCHNEGYGNTVLVVKSTEVRIRKGVRLQCIFPYFGHALGTQVINDKQVCFAVDCFFI